MASKSPRVPYAVTLINRSGSLIRSIRFTHDPESAIKASLRGLAGWRVFETVHIATLPELKDHYRHLAKVGALSHEEAAEKIASYT